MNARSELVRFARSVGWRLLLVVALALVVTGGTYAVAVSPVGTSLASTARRPPGKPADASAQTAAPAPTDATVAAGAASTTTIDSSASQAQSSPVQASPAQATPPQRPPAADGGGRGPSLTRGLPELGMHAAVVGVIVLVLNVARSAWLMIQRRRGGNRAPIFHHVAAGK